jgi:hypothetical protein
LGWTGTTSNGSPNESAPQWLSRLLPFNERIPSILTKLALLITPVLHSTERVAKWKWLMVQGLDGERLLSVTDGQQIGGGDDDDDARKMSFEEKEDVMELKSQAQWDTFDIRLITRELAHLRQVKWFLLAEIAGHSWPTDVIHVIGSYLPWFDVVQMDLLHQHVFDHVKGLEGRVARLEQQVKWQTGITQRTILEMRREFMHLLEARAPLQVSQQVQPQVSYREPQVSPTYVPTPIQPPISSIGASSSLLLSSLTPPPPAILVGMVSPATTAAVAASFEAGGVPPTAAPIPLSSMPIPELDIGALVIPTSPPAFAPHAPLSPSSQGAANEFAFAPSSSSFVPSSGMAYHQASSPVYEPGAPAAVPPAGIVIPSPEPVPGVPQGPTADGAAPPYGVHIYPSVPESSLPSPLAPSEI